MRIGFISDIHEDLVSLKKTLKLIEELNCNFIICLGDIVGFSLPFLKNIDARDANECVALVKENCYTSVAGNHDLYAIKKIPIYQAGFKYIDDWYNLSYNERLKLAKNKIWIYEDFELSIKLSEQAMDYLNSLKEFTVSDLDGIKFLFSHFNYPDLSGSTIKFPKKAKHLIEHFNFMKSKGCLIGVSGHGHIEGCVIANPQKLEFRPYGKYQLTNTQQWIVGPCVANTARSNGIMIFDTNTFQLEVVPLNSPKKNFITF